MPTLLLLDEATSSFDRHAEELCLSLVFDHVMRCHRFCAVVTHNLSLLPLFECVICLHEGQIIADGKY